MMSETVWKAKKKNVPDSKHIILIKNYFLVVQICYLFEFTKEGERDQTSRPERYSKRGDRDKDTGDKDTSLKQKKIVIVPQDQFGSQKKSTFIPILKSPFFVYFLVCQFQKSPLVGFWESNSNQSTTVMKTTYCFACLYGTLINTTKGLILNLLLDVGTGQEPK